MPHVHSKAIAKLIFQLFLMTFMCALYLCTCRRCSSLGNNLFDCSEHVYQEFICSHVNKVVEFNIKVLLIILFFYGIILILLYKGDAEEVGNVFLFVLNETLFVLQFPTRFGLVVRKP